ncbi:PREDICTED: uncharacterized protein LOC109470113 isoform X1 [Branchiostoma belcheri]|uniref:RBR-type E3 ubiquitin transferase n=1 Tax=Branchiostoma belcheri TaxID=7741 RepID=A0A6P4YJ42_BRABE|nr:PREDICTED: uncharacterized protein LOC109470113 isoform X1 [Branchiostoma belcheri]
MVNKKGKHGRHTGNTLRMGCVARKKNKNYRAEFGIYVRLSGPATLIREEGQDMLDDFSDFADDGGISQGALSTFHGRRRQWQRGPNEVFYSMNKRKRWELPTCLKESVSDLERHAESDYRVQVVERELVTAVSGVGRSRADVVSVTDSKRAIPQKKSKRQHAYATDLIRNAKPKKQEKRRRMRAPLEEEEEEHDPIDDLPILKYEFCYPRNADVYPWYSEKQCNQYHCSGKQETPRTKTLKKTKHQRDKKSGYWHGGYSRAEFHKVGTFFEGTDDSEDDRAESETEQLYEARPELPTTGEVLADLLDTTGTAKRKHQRVDSVFGKGCCVPNIASSSAGSIHPKGSAIVCSPTTSDTEDSDTAEENDATTDFHHKDDTVEVLEVYEEKPTVQVFLTTESLKPDELEALTEVGYQESQCVPRVFRLDLYDLVRSQVREGGNMNTSSAQLLFEVGEEISIVDENGQTQECCNTRLSLVTGEEDSVDCDSWGESWEGRVAMTVADVVSQTASFLSGQLSNRSNQKVKEAHKKRNSHSLKVISKICKVQTRSMLPSEAVVSSKKQKEKEQEDTSQNAKHPTTCGICWSDIDAGDIPSAFALQGCLHWFCRECWENHVATKVRQGSTDITCPECECSEVVDDTTLMLLLPGRLYHQYQRRVRNVAVDSDNSLHWCRDSKCGRVVSVTFTGEVADPVPVRCECGSMWCTSCGAEPHWPATCQQAQEHLQEIQHRNPLSLEEATYTAMTKKCPSCLHPMEKNGGCPHMSCICGTSFCWKCGQEYQSHYKNGTFSCPKKPYALEEIEIDSRQVKNMSVYQQKWYKASLEHRRARRPTRMTQAYKQAHRLARKMVLCTDVQLFYRLMEGKDRHTSDNLLLSYMDLTEGAADMVLQMHLAGEYTAVLVSSTSRRVTRNVILNLWRKITFIQDSISRILEEEKPCPSAVQENLEHLMRAGKGCLQNLHRVAVKKNLPITL